MNQNYAYRLLLDADEFYKIKDYQKSLEYYDNSIELDEKNPEAFRGKGNCLQQLHRYDEAIECYNKAISLKKDDSETYYCYGNCFHTLGKNQEAIKNGALLDYSLEENKNKLTLYFTVESINGTASEKGEFTIVGTVTQEITEENKFIFE